MTKDSHYHPMTPVAPVPALPEPSGRYTYDNSTVDEKHSRGHSHQPSDENTIVTFPDLEASPTSSSTASVPTPKPPRSRAQIALIMTALSASVFLAALDVVIVATALPAIARDVNAPDSGFAWIAAAYLVGNAASVPFWARASDVFGRRPALVAAGLVFVSGSVVSAAAAGLGVLVAGRAVQGVGGGGLFGLVSIVIGDLFSPRDRGTYFGIVGAVWGFACGIGPLIGGALADKAGWRWCFWINLPTAGLSLVIILFFLDLHHPKTPLVKGLLAIDWLGTLLFTGATVMLLLGLELGGVVHPWRSAAVLGLIFAGLATYVLFALAERTTQHPLMPRRLFADPDVMACYVADACHALGFAGIAFFLPLYFQVVLDATPIQSGVWLLAITVPLAIGTMAGGVLIKKTGRYTELVRCAMAASTLSFGLMVTLPARRDWPRIIIFQLIAAVGAGPNLQGLQVVLQSLVRPQDIAAGTSMFAFVRQMSIGVGIVVGQVIFQTVMGQQTRRLVAEQGLPAELADLFAGGSTIAQGGSLNTLDEAQQRAVREAVAASLSKVWICFCGVSGVGLVATFLIPQVELSSDHVEMRTGLDADELSPETRPR